MPFSRECFSHFLAVRCNSLPQRGRATGPSPGAGYRAGAGGTPPYPEVGRLAVWVRLPWSAACCASLSTRAAGSSRSRQWRGSSLLGYTWVSFGLEVVRWRIRATCRAARVAYAVVGWMLLGCAGGGEDTTDLLVGGGSWLRRSVARRRSGLIIYSAQIRGSETLYCADS